MRFEERTLGYVRPAALSIESVMKVSDIRVLAEDGYCQLEAQIETEAFGGKSFLWYRFPPEFEKFLSPAPGDPFVAALLPAMVTGEAIETLAPVSPKLLHALTTIQDIYKCWHPDLHKVAIYTPLGEVLGRYPKVPHASAAWFLLWWGRFLIYPAEAHAE